MLGTVRVILGSAVGLSCDKLTGVAVGIFGMTTGAAEGFFDGMVDNTVGFEMGTVLKHEVGLKDGGKYGLADEFAHGVKLENVGIATGVTVGNIDVANCFNEGCNDDSNVCKPVGVIEGTN